MRHVPMSTSRYSIRCIAVCVLSAEPAARSGPQPVAGPRRVLYVALAGDLAIAAAKFFVAALTGSSAMLTEGVHSLVDTNNELLLLYGVRRSERAVDERHPFGYGKATYVYSLIVALSVFSVGGGVSIYVGIISVTGKPVLADPTWNYFLLVVAAAFQAWSWRVSWQGLNFNRHHGETLWRTSKRNMDLPHRPIAEAMP